MHLWKCPGLTNSAASVPSLVSLYVHVPFCTAKCPYCAFASAPARTGDLRLYLDALALEAKYWGAGNPALFSVYIGGGTPTKLGSPEFAELINIIDSNFRLRGKTEVTVEANPESLTEEHIKLWQKWRPDIRVSLGVQSFCDHELIEIGRAHDSASAQLALDMLRKHGVSTGVDLMFGLPGQTLRSFYSSLRQAVAAGIEHISLYQLTPEPGTPFGDEPVPEVCGYGFYRFAHGWLARHGYRQYEVASFAMPGRVRRHNLAYWHLWPCVGIGPGAYGYIGRTRYGNESHISHWAQRIKKYGHATVSEETLHDEAQIREAAVLALRTRWGWRGSCAAIEKTLERYSPRFTVKNGCRWTLTARGFQVANRIWQDIV